jgi:hypothetical protein
MEVINIPGEIQIGTVFLIILILLGFLILMAWLLLTTVNNTSIDLEHDKKKST